MRNHTFVQYALFLSVATLAACAKPAAGPQAPPPEQPVAEAALLLYDNSGGIQDSLRIIVREPAEFAEVWGRATSEHPAPPPMPSVDFGRSMVLVASGGRMTPEDVVRIDSIGFREEVGPTGREERVMNAIVRTIKGCGGFPADAYPVAIVRVQRFTGPVRFTERRQLAEGCTE